MGHDRTFPPFGQPDNVFDPGTGITTAGSEGNPPRFDGYRTLVYKTISETAEVYFVEFRPDQIHVSLTSKPCVAIALKHSQLSSTLQGLSY